MTVAHAEQRFLFIAKHFEHRGVAQFVFKASYLLAAFVALFPLLLFSLSLDRTLVIFSCLVPVFVAHNGDVNIAYCLTFEYRLPLSYGSFDSRVFLSFVRISPLSTCVRLLACFRLFP